MSTIFSTCPRLVDYFLVIELDENAYSEYGNGKIVQRFPEDDWPDISCVNNVDQFCLPAGWHLFKEEQAARFYVAMLTNQDGVHSFCASLVITEACLDGNFTPKAFVILSQHPHMETFRKCLTFFYQIYCSQIHPQYALERVVAKLLGSAIVPSPGGSMFTLALPYGEPIQINSSRSPLMPISGSYVSILFRQIGITNMLSLVCALLTDRKIVLISSSYSTLLHCCLALNALIYPFTYIYVFIPILPIHAVEVVQAPSPFLVGIHRSFIYAVTDADDVIFCDIDASKLTVPSNNPIDFYPEPFYSRAMDTLLRISKPDLFFSDNAFQDVYTRSMFSEDKELRSVFVRIHAEILYGYDKFLCVARILPTIVVSLQKYKFKLIRGYVGNQFISILLDSPIFDKFFTSRGIPYRVTDIFDDVFYKLGNTTSKMLTSDLPTICMGISKKLILNESTTTTHETPQTIISLNLNPKESAPRRELGKYLNSEIIKKEIQTAQEFRNKLLNNPKPKISIPELEKRHVKYEKIIFNFFDSTVGINKRRVQVTKDCLQAIFNGDMFEARKTIPAVLKIVYLKSTRNVIFEEIRNYVREGTISVTSDQYSALSSILKSVLKYSVAQFDYDTAGEVLLLSKRIHRTLPSSSHDMVVCLQEYVGIWYDINFWIELFYKSVEQNISKLHTSYLSELFPNHKFTESALSIAYYWIKNEDSLKDHIDKMSAEEETSVLSLLKYFIELMVSLLLPFTNISSSKLTEEKLGEIIEDVYKSSPDAGKTVTMNDRWGEYWRVKSFIASFIEFISNLYEIGGSYTAEIIRNLPVLISMYVETYQEMVGDFLKMENEGKHGYEAIALFDGEKVIAGPLNAIHILQYSFHDNIIDGHLVLTNYRVVFKGFPSDPNVPHICTVKSLPIGAILSEKKVSCKQLENANIRVFEGWRIRTQNFQVLCVYFPMGVNSYEIESFKKSLIGFMNYTNVNTTFAFKGSEFDDQELPVQSSHLITRVQTIRRSIGLQPKIKNKLLNQTIEIDRQIEYDNVSISSNDGFGYFIECTPLGREFKRLGFNNIRTNGPHVEIVNWNNNKMLSKSYPSYVVNPHNMFPNIAQLSKSHVNGQFPIITWVYMDHKRLLLVSSSYLIRSLCLSSKNTENNTDPRILASSKFLAAILDCTWTRDPSSIDVMHDIATITDIKKSISGNTDQSSIFSVISSSRSSFKPSTSSVYIVVPKSSSKPIRLYSDERCHLITVDINSRSAQKSMFLKIIKLCTPGNSETVSLIRSQAEEIGWFSLIQNIINTANAVVHLMINYKSSVILSLEPSGSDFTTQVSSLAQIMMDPYYRTFEGFQALVEKDWLAFGHRFPNSKTTGNVDTEVSQSPIFTVFLDCMHQVMEQYPLSFQYNDVFLRFMAYHHVSNRFGNFMCAGASKVPCESDIWTFIRSVNNYSLVFVNLYYTPNSAEILRPFPEIFNFTLWEYYTEMIFSSLPIYEFVVKTDSTNENAVVLIESYSLRENDEFVSIWNSSHQDLLLNSGGALYQKIVEDTNMSAIELWRKCTLQMDTIKVEDSVPFISINLAYHTFLCMRFLSGDSNSPQKNIFMSSISHNFVSYTSLVPIRCMHCHQISLNQKNVLRCTNCSYCAHQKCVNLVKSTCNAGKKSSHHSSQQDVDTYNSEQIIYEITENPGDNTGSRNTSICFSSYLFKRGFANRWQKRFFAYDSANHHLLYYVDESSPSAKGCIDLSLVVGVNTLPAQDGQDEVYFDMKTTSRVYSFMANNPEDCTKWIDIINGYIR